MCIISKHKKCTHLASISCWARHFINTMRLLRSSNVFSRMDISLRFVNTLVHARGTYYYNQIIFRRNVMYGTYTRIAVHIRAKIIIPKKPTTTWPVGRIYIIVRMYNHLNYEHTDILFEAEWVHSSKFHHWPHTHTHTHIHTHTYTESSLKSN